MGQDNTVPRRINRVEGAAGQVIQSGGPGVVESWVNLPAPGGPTIVPKTADQIVTNSIVLINDNHLFFAVAANEVWEFSLFLRILSDANPDFKYAFTVPVGGAIWISQYEVMYNEAFLPSDATGAVNVICAGAFEYFVRAPLLYIGGGNAGNVQLQWAQRVADGAVNTTLLENSYFIAHQIQ